MTEGQDMAGMTGVEFKAARHKLQLSSAELARILDTNPQTVRRWEMDPERDSTARPPNPIACQAVRWMLAGFRPPEWPTRLAAR